MSRLANKNKISEQSLAVTYIVLHGDLYCHTLTKLSFSTTTCYSKNRQQPLNFTGWNSFNQQQLLNLKSLGFTRERIANLVGVFPEVVLCDIDFSGFFDVAFDLHISSIVRFVVDLVAKVVLFVSVAEADDSSAPTLKSSLFSPLLRLSLIILGNSLPRITDGCWFSSISHFSMFPKSTSDCTIFFGAFSLLITLE